MTNNNGKNKRTKNFSKAKNKQKDGKRVRRRKHKSQLERVIAAYIKERDS